MKFEPESFLEPETDAAKLESPQFDDERTLLSARRVVPLDQVRSKRQIKRRATIILWITVAFLLTGAGFIYFWPDHRSHAQPAQVTPAQAPTETDALKTAPGIETATSTATPNDAEVDPQQKPRSLSTAMSRPRAMAGGDNRSVPPDRFAQASIAKKDAQFDSRPRRISDEPEIAVGDEDQHLDNRTGRDVRREARQWQRRRDRSSPGRDGVFRIRDIFEGPQRP